MFEELLIPVKDFRFKKPSTGSLWLHQQGLYFVRKGVFAPYKWSAGVYPEFWKSHYYFTLDWLKVKQAKEYIEEHTNKTFTTLKAAHQNLLFAISQILTEEEFLAISPKISRNVTSDYRILSPYDNEIRTAISLHFNNDFWQLQMSPTGLGHLFNDKQFLELMDNQYSSKNKALLATHSFVAEHLYTLYTASAQAYSDIHYRFKHSIPLIPGQDIWWVQMVKPDIDLQTVFGAK